MKLWIDTTTGTWGEVEGSNGRLMIVELHDEPGNDYVLSRLDAMSDEELFNFAITHGHVAQ